MAADAVEEDLLQLVGAHIPVEEARLQARVGARCALPRFASGKLCSVHPGFHLAALPFAAPPLSLGASRCRGGLPPWVCFASG